MAELKDKIKIALDESRMLVLGTQILLGFQFRSTFEPAFEQLPKSSQYSKMIGLMILLTAITLIMAPGSYHRIVRAGSDAEDVHQFTTTMMDLALIPFLLVHDDGPGANSLSPGVRARFLHFDGKNFGDGRRFDWRNSCRYHLPGALVWI